MTECEGALNQWAKEHDAHVNYYLEYEYYVHFDVCFAPDEFFIGRALNGSTTDMLAICDDQYRKFIMREVLK